MGLISLTWVFCHNLVKIHSVVIEIHSFSCSVLLLVKADGDHLAVPNCKTRILQRAVSHLPPNPRPSPQKGNDYFRSKK